MKSAPIKPKPCQTRTCDDATWIGPAELLPATFQWESPALQLPTRRDALSLPWILEMDRAVRALWSHTIASPSGIPPAIEPLSKAIHGAYQGWQASQLARNALTIQCGPGCSTCCRQYPLGIHAFEVLYLYHILRPLPEFKSRLEACRSRADNFLAWTEFVKIAYPNPGLDAEDRLALSQEHDFDDNQACPFLDARGSCSIHPERPLTCRMFLSRSPSEFCSSELNTSPEADQITLPPEEAVTLRLWKLDRQLDFWGHDGSLFGSLVALHDHILKESS
jgi:Fe-S-cluster containining protein